MRILHVGGAGYGFAFLRDLHRGGHNGNNRSACECSCYFGAAVTGSTTSTLKTTKVSSTTISTRTTTGSGPTSTATDACGTPDFNLYGYGAGTTGGGSATPVTVTSCSALLTAVDNAMSAGPSVTEISGTLSGCGIIDLGSDITIVGVGASSGLTGGGFRIKESSNVIIRNLVFHDAPESYDQIQLNYATYVWIDHCDFSSDGIVGDKDYYDGLVDITHASDFVTLSWNKLHDHWKADLIGHSDNNGAEDTGHLRVTEHHNYWNNVNSRTPSIRFGTAHIYSSCFTNIPTSGIDCRENAEVLVEQNYFSNVTLAIATDIESDVGGYATDLNNIYADSSTTEITQVGSVTPPYKYVLDEASCVCDFLDKYAGTGVVTGL
ncbi:pectin lyase fold/virulence factor [Xylariaceae sp. FL0255]|nr:pectin lyase fold/virulence factor [Xylariaceae sp. FL0255]